MLNIQKYQKQLSNCKTQKEVCEFIARYKESNESYIDWLVKESPLEQDKSSEYFDRFRI